MLHLKLTSPDLANPRRVKVAVNESPGDNLPDWFVDVHPGCPCAGSWGERGVAHLVLLAPGGQGVSLEMTGLAALSLVHAMIEASSELWATEQYLDRAPATDVVLGPDRLES